jgi:acyl-CoA synthetase (AMP-forming)/AMP-acid ligase II/NAD(P)-dependent dehydrogenase (short-subunit alcohol dehydrogenase family)
MSGSDRSGPKELLPRPVRLLIGATGPGVSERKLRDAVAGRVVLITGASSGVGEASARRLGAAGATVLLVARRRELLEAVRDEIAAAGGSAYVHPCDLADTDQVGALVTEVLQQHGQVDVVISNAGLSIRRWVSDSYDRFHDFERTTNVNYLGPVRLLLGLLPSMRERGSGHIVNVATVGVDFPAMRWSAYIASKTAFETWLGGVAPEILPDGVTVTSIHLQLVRSPMLGPFRMWRYIPGMSPDEAAGLVGRAVADRPRTIAPMWARIGGPLTQVAQAPVERVLAGYAARVNRSARPQRESAGDQSADLPPEAGSPGGASKLVAQSARLADEAVGGALTIAAARVIRPVRLDRIARVLLAQRRYGFTPAFAAALGAELHRDRAAVIDELGQITFGELDARARSLAGALHRHFDLGSPQRVAIMCRNHRGFVEAAVAASRLGCDLVPLNTDFAGPQLGDVLARERVSAAVHDQEFDAVFGASGFAGARIAARLDGETHGPKLESLIALGERDAPAPRAAGRIVMLTSGTTGTPKGAHRTISAGALAPLAVAGLLDLSRIKPTPRSGAPFVVAPPLFHLYGLIGLMAAFGLGSPIVIRTRFDAEATVAAIAATSAEVLLAVPTMLGRIMDLPEEARGRHDCGSLRMIVSGAAPLPPELAIAVMDQFGEVLYNGYASTEVGVGTLATPRDLRRAPGTVGRPVAGVKVRILDEEGVELPPERTGRIFVGSPMLFDGYSGGGGKEIIDGLMSSGDVGHFDRGGRLFIDGRDDDMILSGGENVFPQEVEEALIAHDEVVDAAVLGVPDRDFGQRLAAYVVLKPDGTVSPEELKLHVKSHLARHKVPREIAFVPELPRTSTGKLQRRRLSELLPDDR